MKRNAHSFDVDDAIQHGIEKAIILYNLRFWLERAKANDSHKHDGYHWTYNSASAIAKLFPYMSSQKIARLLREMEKDGIIKSGIYNKTGYDKTKWYTMSGYECCSDHDDPLFKNEQGSFKNEQPIPDVITDLIPDKKHYSSSDDDVVAIEAAFDAFWKAGMRKQNKQKAMLAFKRELKKSGMSPEQFAHTLINDIQARIRLKQMGFDNMHPTTYLNGQRWEDEYADDRQQQKQGRAQMDWDSDFINDPNRLEL